MFKTLWLSTPRPPPREGCRMASSPHARKRPAGGRTAPTSNDEVFMQWFDILNRLSSWQTLASEPLERTFVDVRKRNRQSCSNIP
jgi:hypothetical protein